MPRNNSEEERLTEDEIARRKLGPRGVPSGEDSAKMTPQQEKNLPKEGEFDGHVVVLMVGGEWTRASPPGVSAGSDLGVANPFPARPKGMHW
jgi:hypothetical protein